MRKIAIVLAVLSAFVTAFAGSASAGTIFYNIRVAHTNKCLDVDNTGGGIGNGRKAQQWTCLGKDQANQIFVLVPVAGTDKVKIRAVHSNRCLDVFDLNPNNGADVVQWDCIVGAKNQEWTFLFDGAGHYQIRSSLNQKCLDVDTFGGGTANGTRVQMWTCLGNAQLNQRWNLVSI